LEEFLCSQKKFPSCRRGHGLLCETEDAHTPLGVVLSFGVFHVLQKNVAFYLVIKTTLDFDCFQSFKHPGVDFILQQINH